MSADGELLVSGRSSDAPSSPHPSARQVRHMVGQFLIPPGKAVSLRTDFDPGYTAEYVRKRDARSLLSRDIERLKHLQDRFYAQKTHALLIILQALDAAGKDSVIKHVISGLNPQGCHVWSFKQPSADELAHDYLWRTSRLLPSRGIIGIFNRSYYEEVLVVRVHRELLEREGLPDAAMTHGIWRQRFDEITRFEQYLVDNGVVVLKFFLHVSKEEQRQRFLKRIERADKNWKFSANDVHERAFWDAYMDAYEDMLQHTSTAAAPWYVVPADHKWFTRLGVAAVTAARLEELNPSYPSLTQEQRRELAEAHTLLQADPEPSR